jgi:exosortase D (VPLPA-CTERM-specific)
MTAFPRDSMLPSWRPGRCRWLCPAVYLALAIPLYNDAYAVLFAGWRGEDYSYCFLLPPIAAYLFWEKRQQWSAAPAASWAGLATVLAALLLYFLGELGGEFYSIYLSSWLLAAGLCWLHLGWRRLEAIAFPLCFLLAMFPLPSVVYSTVSLELKLLSSRLGVSMLRAFGVEVYREGNVIDLGFTRLQVVDACSGLRYLIPLLILGVLLTHLFRPPAWQRCLLVASAVPVTVVTNSLRIASVGLLYPLLGPQAAEGFFHEFSGWLIFMFSLALLLGEIWLLGRVFPGGGGAGEPAAASAPQASTAGAGPPAAAPAAAARGVAQFLLVTAMLVASLLSDHALQEREKVPLAKPLLQFPLDLGEWQGARTSLQRPYLDALKLSDYLLADFRNAEGCSIGLYIAYNDSQRKGEATHSPASCLPGSGWVFQSSGAALLPVQSSNGAPVQVNRCLVQKGGDRLLLYFWFPQRGRILTSMAQLKLYLFWDALTRKRTDGAMVRLATPVYPFEEPGRAEARLASFSRSIFPLLQSYIPN